jgi:hypothetical protein
VPPTLKSLLFLAVLLRAFIPTGTSGQALSPDTKRILDGIAARQPKVTAADRAAAHKLNAEGDHAYRQRQYGAAFTAYMNSYPNTPNAYAYIMAGDAHWRDVLKHAQQSPPPPHGTSGCPLDNAYFAHDLSSDLSQNQQVGLALADRHLPGASLSPGILHRAQEETACLQSMAQQYTFAPASSCVDLHRLEHCLGAPLIR